MTSPKPNPQLPTSKTIRAVAPLVNRAAIQWLKDNRSKLNTWLNSGDERRYRREMDHLLPSAMSPIGARRLPGTLWELLSELERAMFEDPNASIGLLWCAFGVRLLQEDHQSGSSRATMRYRFVGQPQVANAAMPCRWTPARARWTVLSLVRLLSERRFQPPFYFFTTTDLSLNTTDGDAPLSTVPMEIVRAPKPDIDEQDRSDGFSSVYCGPLDAALTHIYPRLVGPLVRALDATTSSVNELAFAEAMAKIDDVISRKIEQIPPQEWPRLIGISGARADELSRKILTMPGHESLAVTGLAFAKYLAIMHVASPSWHRITFVPASGALNADDQPGGLVMCHSDEPVAAGRQRLSRSHPKVFSAVSPLSPLDREDIGAALMNGLRPLQLTRLGYTASLKGESKGMHEAARSLLQSLAHAHGSRRSFYNQFLQSQLQRVLPAADPMTIQDIRDHLLSPLEVQGRLLYHADDMFSDASRGLWSPLIDVTAFFSKQAHDSGFIDLSIDSPASLSNVEVRRMSWVAFVELYDNAWRHAPRPSGRARLVWSVDGPTQGFVTIRTINDATPKSITEIGTWKPREGVSLSERLRGLDILDYICRLSGGSFRIRPVDSYKVECSITLACRMVSEVTEGARE